MKVERRCRSSADVAMEMTTVGESEEWKSEAEIRVYIRIYQ